MATEAGDRILQLDPFFLPSRGANQEPPRPANNWLEQPEFPSEEEILSPSPPNLLFLENNDIKSKEEYLEKHYRMQRYEAIEPTRLAVEHFICNPDLPEGDQAYIYTNVQTQGIVLTANGAAIRVSFLPHQQGSEPIDWANSKRLLQGSLVVLSPVDNSFRTKCLVATIAYRFLSGGLWPDLDADPPEPDDTQPRVDLYFASLPEKIFDTSIKYYMLEARDGYFESFRHTMRALQTAAFENFNRSLLDKYVLENDIKEIQNQQPEIPRQQTRNSLDKSQLAACQAIMGQELSITQGPPGTGKTFTTVASIDEIIRQKITTKPLIVAAQTNHALDQLLERCLDKGLAICRLGGRTASETIEEYSLFNTRRNNRGTVETSPETDPLLAWLGWTSFIPQSQTPNLSVAAKWKSEPGSKTDTVEEAKRALDPDKPIGPYIRLSKQSEETQAARFEGMLSRNRDLYKVKAQHREELFKYMCYELSRQSKSKLQEYFSKFDAACQRLQRNKTERDHRVVARTQIQILGCTITGLSKYRQLLSVIGPDVLIIDEASEATEGSIAAALFPSLKHLALVGDHQQLTPRPIHQLLTDPIFALNVSLFERLVTQGMPFKVLNIQRRMIPEIRYLINLFYPNLQDHSSVLKRDPVKGLGPALWWFDHKWAEQTSASGSGHSFSNNSEADMVVEFANHLFRCGTPVDKLTILTFYTGQQELIQSKLGVHSLGSSICKTVDSFQGCENDIILLSMVRGQMPGQRPKVGFLDNKNRVTVALSRARNALYIFGNAANIQGSETWAPIIDALWSVKHDHVPLVCPIHGTKSFVRSLEDWSIVAGEAGCRGELCESASVIGSDKSGNAALSVTHKLDARLDEKILGQVDAASSPARWKATGDSAPSTTASQDSCVTSSGCLIDDGYAETNSLTAVFQKMAENGRREEMLRKQQEYEEEEDASVDSEDLISFE
ncbi:hypothetical protein PWT90_02458 [Aphanocladium album]|nr:hypothetical protein PWT90_02458 [Aphanocladium album]